MEIKSNQWMRIQASMVTMQHRSKSFFLYALLTVLFGSMQAQHSAGAFTGGFSFEMERQDTNEKEVFLVYNRPMGDQLLSQVDVDMNRRVFASSDQLSEVVASLSIHRKWHKRAVSLGAYRTDRVVEGLTIQLTGEGDRVVRWEHYPDAEGYFIFRSEHQNPVSREGSVPEDLQLHRVIPDGNVTSMTDQVYEDQHPLSYYVMAYSLSSGSIFITRPVGSFVEDDYLAEWQVNVYPSLVTNRSFWMEATSGPMEEMEIDVCNALGQSVQKMILPAGSVGSRQEVQLRALNSGCYFVRFTQGEHTQLNRIIVQ
ncbi:MAG: T9SS type A sorting domain-containing protein [Bacteroidota bacterium]